MRTSTKLILASCLWLSAFMSAPSHSDTKGPGFDCFNPKSSVESAVCGDAELSKLYRRSAEAYERLKSNPAAFDIMLTLVRARRACIIWMPGEPYQACIILAEQAALKAYNKLEPKKKKSKKAKRKRPLHKSEKKPPTHHSSAAPR
jgi:uncharacterized protein